MFRLLIIGSGGFLGAISRYLLSGFAHKLVKNFWFPYGTLTVNVLGCFFIGLLSGMAENRQFFTPETRAFLLIGFLGSFTTFSTFSYETLGLARDGLFGGAFLNLSLQIVLGLFGVWLGNMVSKMI
jgi:CrcB protein